MQGAPFIMMRGGREPWKGEKLAQGTIKRALAYAKPYWRSIAGYLVVVVIAGGLVVAPAKIVEALLDSAIKQHDKTQVAELSIAGLVVAGLVAITGLLGRYLSSRVGEGLIFDLRVKLFDHVQRMPLAFFTRTQTGALISRLNSDVDRKSTRLNSSH